jgi:hypothetical protein
MVHLNTLDRLLLQRGAEHLHQLGPRATAELLAEVGQRIGGMQCIIGLLGEYQQRLSLQMLRAVGAQRFPTRPMRVVSR